MGAFDAFENATLFVYDDGNVIENEDGFGNSKIDASLITVRCYIKQSSVSQFSSLVRETMEGIPIEGRCISPVQFPVGFRASTVVNGTVNGQSYRIRVVPKILSSMYDEASILGQGFTGELLNSTAWGNT